MTIIVCIVGVALIICAVPVVKRVRKSPYTFPYYIYEFDVSGMVDPCIDDMIDNMLIQYGIAEILQHNTHIVNWEKEMWSRASKSPFKQLRRRQYLEVIDDDHAFVFCFVTPKMVWKDGDFCLEHVRLATYSYNIVYLVNRYTRLKDTEFRCTLNELEAKKVAE